MHTARKALAALSAALLLASPLVFSVAAQEAASGELTVLSYNVAGLPLIRDGRNPWQDSKLISAHFAEGAYDLVGTQEDFNCHRQLISKLGEVMPFQTVRQGGIPVGDGLSVFSKHPVYNQKRVTWAESFGVFTGSTDELTPKGFAHTVVSLNDDPNGPKADFFTLHADAGGDPNSIAAREANYRQLSAYINENCQGRALIVTGDFNAHYDVQLGRVPAAKLVTELVPGLRDSWFECSELGLPAGRPAQLRQMPENGDSIDHVMVRDGGGVTFTFIESKNLNIQRVEGKAVAAEGWLTEGEARHSLSDHSARYAKLAWAYDKTMAFDYGQLNEPAWSFSILARQIKSVFHTLALVIAEPFKMLWDLIA